ncbi:MAG: glycohydrolase toxin TNT-related protein [Labedaea sp.]
MQPTPLDPTEQDALVKQIGLAMLRAAPADWDRITVDYRAVGRYFEAEGELTFADEHTTDWPVPPEIAGMFARLRTGMYREGRGTWFNAKYRLDHPSSYNLDYDREEPDWAMPPPPQAYGDDLRTFPRSEENVPDWLRHRAAGSPPDVAGRIPPVRFRVARIFDGPGGNGRPAVNRPPLADEDRAAMLDYLNGGPVIMQSRGLDLDRLDQEGRPLVPVAFHTDGTWIWPAAVNYYLHNYGVAPESDLVEHIRRAAFRMSEVDEPTRAAAAAFIGRGAPAAPRGPGVPLGAPAGGSFGPPPPGMPLAAAGRAPVVPPPSRRAALAEAAPVPPPAPTMAMRRAAAAPPAAALPSQAPPAAVIDGLRTRFGALGVPASAYRIGPPAERTWTMESTPDGWRVGWYESEFVAPAMFEDVADAAAFLLGKVLLDTATRAPRATLPEPRPQSTRTPPMHHDPPGGLFNPEPMPANRGPAEPGAPFLPEVPPPLRDGPAHGQPGPDDLFSPDVPLRPPAIGAPAHAADPGSKGAFEPEAEPADDAIFGPDSPSRGLPALPSPDEATIEAEPVAAPDTPGRRPVPRPTLAVPGPELLAPAPTPPRAVPQPTLAVPEHELFTPAHRERESRQEPRPELRPDAKLEARPEVRTEARPEPVPQTPQRWPIQPFAGEPPLTLFRGKRMVELAPGTEVDRFGEPDGNLTYAAGTPFGQRSLVPEWIERPFHTYRVARPMQALSGAAIPWFDQIGGGTAYLLPDAIEELILDGWLIEVPGRQPPA